MPRNTVNIVVGLLALACFVPARAPTAETDAAAKQTIPYVPTRHDVVQDALKLAEVGANDVVYDMGSGDGRIVIAAIRDFGVRKAVGVEIDPRRLRESREAVQRAGVAGRVEIVEGDLFSRDFSEADVVFLYLGQRPNTDLRAKLYRSLKPGSRVVSHQFGMGEWPPDKLLRVRTPYLGMFGVAANPFSGNPRVPDFGDLFELATHSTVRVWITPASIGGVWRGNLATPEGDRELKLVLHQRLGEASGSFQLATKDQLEGGVRTDLWGNHLRFDAIAGGKRNARWMFDGHVAGEGIAGKFATFEGGEQRELPWAGKRDESSLVGCWEWTGQSGSRPVRLRIERRDGRLAATYTDRELTVPVVDFYDFGGGFYFTLLIGRQPDGGLVITPDAGWLIGEAIADGNTLQGTIEFYPYPGATRGGKDAPAGQQEWRPQRVPDP